ncbi:MAG: cupin [Gammaproteobacteria bacterium HGW-Gammaproteobacteria-7]|nr:MAG: cupin [Gammaproteobacteria bacterium HGW-Gammaproteobacteria-7]
MTPRIVHLEDLRPRPIKGDEGPVPERYQGSRLADIGEMLGARTLGYNLTVVPPGKAAFPAHNHYGNEEMFLILEGAGEVRIGDQVFPVRAGHVIACPTGGPETAHQLRNTSSDTALAYLAVSTTRFPDLVQYPDSGKIGAVHYDNAGRAIQLRNREADNLSYWDGEN